MNKILRKIFMLSVCLITGVLSVCPICNDKTEAYSCNDSIQRCNITLEVIGRLREFHFFIRPDGGSYYGRYMTKPKLPYGPELMLTDMECDTILKALNELPSIDKASMIKSDSLYINYGHSEWPWITIEAQCGNVIKSTNFYVCGIAEDMPTLYTSQFLKIYEIIYRLSMKYYKRYLWCSPHD